MVSFKAHTSQANVTVGLIIRQYIYNFDILETNLLIKRRAPFEDIFEEIFPLQMVKT